MFLIIPNQRLQKLLSGVAESRARLRTGSTDASVGVDKRKYLIAGGMGGSFAVRHREIASKRDVAKNGTRKTHVR